MLQGCTTTKIYCRFDCPPGRRMKQSNRVTFDSRAEAVGTGYRACKTCKPDSPADGKPWKPKRK